MNKAHKIFLERLRRSGVVNMFGAAPYLAGEFDLDLNDARRILTEWMKTYDREDSDYADF